MLGTRKTIQIKKSHEGPLHKDLDTPLEQPIMAANLEEALHSSDPVVWKRRQFVKHVHPFHHPKKG
ncbi:MAG TPA: hypothetical protein DHV93_03535 [Holophagaceae bacterium]|nr:hypothetical protein [Holophagaceae bacterium]